MTYLDNAATTIPKPPSVALAAARAVRELGSPGRGGHRYAMDAAETAFSCREAAAKLFNVPEPDNVVLTTSATHGLNIAIRSVVREGARVVTTGFEHNSVVRPLYALGAEIVPVPSKPFDDAERTLALFEDALRTHPDAAVLNHVSNVFGCVFPIAEAAALCRDRGVPLIVDASQSAGSLDVDLQAFGARFIAMPGHKGLYGPQGTGLLLCAEKPKPLIFGGSGSDSASPAMPDILPDIAEAGTHNMPGIAGLLEGLRFVLKTGTGRISAHERRLIGLMALELSKIPGVAVYSGEEQGAALSFTVEGVSPEETARRLAEMGIAVRAGLHCAPMAHKSAGTYPTGTVRASVSAFSRQNDVFTLAEALRQSTKHK